MLIPSTRHALRTRKYMSTMYILVTFHQSLDRLYRKVAGGTVFDRHVQAVEPPTWDIIAPPFTHQGSAQYRKALSYHLQTYMRATAFPNITGTTKRNSSSLHPVRRSVHHHRGAVNIRQPLCPILLAYMVDSRRAPDSERCLWR